MQTITTKYVGPSNVRGSRIIAKASGNNTRSIVSYDCGLSDQGAHLEAVKSLCAKLGWTGEMIGGHSKDGMVWVFVADLSPRIILPNSSCGKSGPNHGHYDATDPNTHKFVSGEVR